MGWHDFKGWEKVLIVIIGGWALIGWFFAFGVPYEWRTFVLNAPFFLIMAGAAIVITALWVIERLLRLLGR